jgi:hypothetical protein
MVIQIPIGYSELVVDIAVVVLEFLQSSAGYIGQRVGGLH